VHVADANRIASKQGTDPFGRQVATSAELKDRLTDLGVRSPVAGSYWSGDGDQLRV
jgi:hypothetical protein